MCPKQRRTSNRCFSIHRIRERAAVAGFNQQHVRFFGMGRANVQVVSTRAGLHSLAHRYGRTIRVFTKVLSSDRIILNQYSIRGDALWYALPALSRPDANPCSDSFTGCDRKNSRLPRPALPLPQFRRLCPNRWFVSIRFEVRLRMLRRRNNSLVQRIRGR